jgi:hypothetical protein
VSKTRYFAAGRVAMNDVFLCRAHNHGLGFSERSQRLATVSRRNRFLDASHKAAHAYSAANGSRLRWAEAVPTRNIALMPAGCALTASAKQLGEPGGGKQKIVAHDQDQAAGRRPRQHQCNERGIMPIIEVWVVLGEDGDCEVATDEYTARERLMDGSDENLTGTACRVVKLNVTMSEPRYRDDDDGDETDKAVNVTIPDDVGRVVELE